MYQYQYLQCLSSDALAGSPGGNCDHDFVFRRKSGHTHTWELSADG
jgi:hypothetical protein